MGRNLIRTGREFSRLHGISMVLNLAVILAGTILILGYETLKR